jgi:predicted SnoaL-like aldol condensation-catalyzing enzyme
VNGKSRSNVLPFALLARVLLGASLVPGVGLAALSASVSNGTATAELEAQRQANVKTVMAYYAAALKDDFEEARKFIGSRYVEHDPERKDGVAGLQQAFEQDKAARAQKAVSHQIVIADNDLVVLMSQLASTPMPVSRPATANPAPGAAPPAPPATSTAGVPVGGPLTGSLIPSQTTVRTQAELFRLEDGKIVEHWLTIQGLGNP